MSGYKHIGRHVYITKKRELKADIVWWHKFVDRLEGLVENILDREIKLEWIDDRMLEGQYIEDIKFWGDKMPEKWERFSEEL